MSQLTTYTDGSGYGDDSINKISSALVAELPKGFDINADILIQGKADTTKVGIVMALRSRKLLVFMETAPPSLSDVRDANPSAPEELVIEVYLDIRQKYETASSTVADILPVTLKMSSLSMMEENEVNALVLNGDGRGLYDWILSAMSVERGRPQDKLRAEYPKVKVSTSDKPEQLVKAIEKKWWLYQNITIFDHSSETGVKEAMSNIFTMLLDGPAPIASEAARNLTSLENTSYGDGVQWITNYTQMLRRHGDKLLRSTEGGNDHEGSLMLLQRKIAALETSNKNTPTKPGGAAGKPTANGCKLNCGIITCKDPKTCVMITTEYAGLNSPHGKYIGGPSKDKPNLSAMAIIEHARGVFKKDGVEGVKAFIAETREDKLKDTKSVFERLKEQKDKGTLQMLTPGGERAPAIDRQIDQAQPFQGFGPASKMAVATGALLAQIPASMTAELETVEGVTSGKKVSFADAVKGTSTFMMIAPKAEDKQPETPSKKEVGFGNKPAPNSMLRISSSRVAAYEKSRQNAGIMAPVRTDTQSGTRGTTASMITQAAPSVSGRSMYSQATTIKGTQLKSILESAAEQYKTLADAVAKEEVVSTKTVNDLAKSVQFDRGFCDIAGETMSQIFNEDDDSARSDAPASSTKTQRPPALLIEEKDPAASLRSVVELNELQDGFKKLQDELASKTHTLHQVRDQLNKEVKLRSMEQERMLTMQNTIKAQADLVQHQHQQKKEAEAGFDNAVSSRVQAGLRVCRARTAFSVVTALVFFLMGAVMLCNITQTDVRSAAASVAHKFSYGRYGVLGDPKDWDRLDPWHPVCEEGAETKVADSASKVETKWVGKDKKDEKVRSVLEGFKPSVFMVMAEDLSRMMAEDLSPSAPTSNDDLDRLLMGVNVRWATNMDLGLAAVWHRNRVTIITKLKRGFEALKTARIVGWMLTGLGGAVLMPLIESGPTINKQLPVVILFAGKQTGRASNSSLGVQIRKMGVPAEEWDNSEGADFQDLSVPAIQNPILRNLRNGRHSGMHAGPVCTTFSIVNDEHLRSLEEPRGRSDLSVEQRKRVEYGNVLADFAIEACWAAYAGGTSFTLEFPSFRGAVYQRPARAYWPEKAGYPTILHFERLQQLIDASGARVVTFPLCLLGSPFQKYVSLVVWPPDLARLFESVDGQECFHTHHEKLAVGEAADASKEYPAAFDEMIASCHVQPRREASSLDVGSLQLNMPTAAEQMRFLSDNGASDHFVKDDIHCVPGSEGPPTVSEVVVGNAGASLAPIKSCLLPVGWPGNKRVDLIRVNVAPDVPINVFSEGLLTEQLKATFVRGPDAPWTMALPPSDVITLDPGPGRLSRLGFFTIEVRPQAALMLLHPVNDSANLDVEPFPQSVEDDEPTTGVLMLSAHTPAHVHMRAPVYSPIELLRLQHARFMMPAISTLVRTHEPDITVGHDFGKVTPAAIKEFCKEGNSICNSSFAQPTPKNGPTPRPTPDKPVGFYDSFGPVRVPCVYFNYVYANTTVFEPWGWMGTSGSQGLAEEVHERALSEQRAFVRTFHGEIVANRTDMLKATTTSHKWKEYARGSTPFQEQHSVAGKHHMLAIIERVHKDAWPMVLAALRLARRGLKWWYVCWRHAILMINVQATRRDGDGSKVTSRYKQFFDVAFNQSVLRVLLSPCQYFVDPDQRYKPDPKMRNGLWCGISPDNLGAAWIWNGREFITCEHGDLRTNEWLAWSIAPVGSPAPDLLDQDGEFNLFSDNTAHRVCTLVEPAAESGSELAKRMESAEKFEPNKTPPSKEVAQALQRAQSVAAAATAITQKLDVENKIRKRAADIRAAGRRPGPHLDAVDDALRRRADGNARPQDEAVINDAHALHDFLMAEADEAVESGGAAVPMQVNTAVAPSTSIASPPVKEHRISQASLSKARHADRITRAQTKARGAVLTLAHDAMLRDSFEVQYDDGTENETPDIMVLSAAVKAAHDAIEELDQLDFERDMAAEVSDAMMLIASHPDARKEVTKVLDRMESKTAARVAELRVNDASVDYLMNMLPVEAHQGVLYLLSSSDPNEPESEVIGAVGFCGAMVTLYDELGEPVQLDEPQTWGEYLRSPRKAKWTDAIVTEVNALENAMTWVRVPRSKAREQKKQVLPTKFVFKVKSDSQKHHEKDKARFVVLGNMQKQGKDYLEHYAAGASFGNIRMVLITVVQRRWMRFRLDVSNAFPQHDAEEPFFIELPKGPFDWRNPTTGEIDIGECSKNLYGTRPAPRVWVTGFSNYHTKDMAMEACDSDKRVFRRGDETDGVIVAVYMDEAFGGGTPDRVAWYIDAIKKRYPCTVEYEWNTVLGFGVTVTHDNYLEFSTKKYVKELKDRFLPGEAKPSRAVPARETITTLPAEIDKLPELGSPEDMAMHPMQTEGQALNGALTHLSRGRCDTTFQSAVCAQQAARMSYAAFEHLKEIARYAWAHEDDVIRHCGPDCKSLVLSPRPEPIRPYDEDGAVEYGLYGMGDGAQALPNDTVPNSKAMGGDAVMFGAAAIDWKSYRLHTCTPDSTSMETMVASRLVSRLVGYRKVAQFLGIPQVRPSHVMTDNDGTWYVARDATGLHATAMVYIVRHVRFIQQATFEQEIAAYQVDGVLNPTDVLTKYVARDDFRRHQAFLMGYPARALELWRSSSKYLHHKKKRIISVRGTVLNQEKPTASKGAMMMLTSSTSYAAAYGSSSAWFQQPMRNVLHTSARVHVALSVGANGVTVGLRTTKARKNVKVRFRGYYSGHGRKSDAESWTESVDEDCPGPNINYGSTKGYHGRYVRPRV